MSTSPLVLDQIVIPHITGTTILDVGCGYGKWGFLARAYFWMTKTGGLTTNPYVVGVDMFLPHLLRLKKMGIYDDVLNASVLHLPFSDKAFETVIVGEVIEHLPKEDGAGMLSEIERVASKCIMLSTPDFECIREGIAGLDGYNPYEAHKSCWSVQELEMFGYNCSKIGSVIFAIKEIN